MRDTARDVILATRRRVDVMIARGEGAALLRVLDRAQTHLERRLRELRGGATTTFTGQHAHVAMALVTDAIKHAREELAGHVSSQVAAMARLGTSQTLAIVRAGEAQFRGLAYELPIDVAARLDSRLQHHLATRLRQAPTSVDRYSVRMVRRFEEVLQVGVLTRMSVGQMIDTLVRHGGPKGPEVSVRATVLPDGRVKRLATIDAPKGLFRADSYWAERIVRTEMLYAYNGAAQATIEELHREDGQIKRIILAHFDARTAQDSIFVHGEIRGPHEPFVDGAGRVYLFPPARPNDREIVVPHRSTWPMPESFLPKPRAEREAAASAAKGAEQPSVEESLKTETKRARAEAPRIRPDRRVSEEEVQRFLASRGPA